MLRYRTWKVILTGFLILWKNLISKLNNIYRRPREKNLIKGKNIGFNVAENKFRKWEEKEEEGEGRIDIKRCKKEEIKERWKLA